MVTVTVTVSVAVTVILKCHANNHVPGSPDKMSQCERPDHGPPGVLVVLCELGELLDQLRQGDMTAGALPPVPPSACSPGGWAS